jgi:opacity protein-like surface antigen
MRRTAAAVALLLVAPAAAIAQEGGAQLAAGYSYARSEGESLHGWTASVAVPAGRTLSLVGEASTHYGEQDLADLTRLSLFAGPRLGFGSGSPRPFVHLLAGVVRTSASISVRGVTISESATDLGGAAGAGLDFRLGDRWSLRLQGDYVLVKAETETLTDPRASLAAVYRFGGS